MQIKRLTPLPRAFFDRDPRRVGRDLLGKVLVRRGDGRDMAARIVETEAYLGKDDAAAHAAAGRTSRNSVIFGPPGHAYVYFIYGNYYCLNVSCLAEGQAGCVLIRALEPLVGLEEMARNRGLLLAKTPWAPRLLTSGPGRLCDALAISRVRDNGRDMTVRESGLWIGDDGSRPRRLTTTTRVGITKSAHAPLRYLMAGNPFVSGPKSAR